MLLRAPMASTADEGRLWRADRMAMQDADLAIMFSEGPALVADQAFTTGRVDLKSFEKVLSPSTMKIGRVGNFGCYPEAFTAEEREKGSVPDQFRHEIGTAFNLKGRGLIVLSSCSHRGIVNIVKQAQAVSAFRKSMRSSAAFILLRSRTTMCVTL